MSALTGLTVGTPDNSYKGLLHFSQNGIITGTLRDIQDGDGNNTGLKLSTTTAEYTGIFAFAGNGVSNSAVTIGDSITDDEGVRLAIVNQDVIGSYSKSSIILMSGNGTQSTSIYNSMTSQSSYGIVRGLTIRANNTNGRFAISLGQAYLGSGSVTWAIMQDSAIEHHAIDSTSNYLTQSIDSNSNVVWAISGGTVPTITFNSPFVARVRPRTLVQNAPSATPSINSDIVDFQAFTGITNAITSLTTNLTGTPTEAQKLWLAFTDNGTARAITWGASFENGSATLPTTTVISTRLDVGFIWNTVTSKWRCVAQG